ncbi:hypothetical protein niasHS_000468 [Heterodera schachtii]|uniref:Ankyrin repeat protein n=1 Tax=Heterodera schachtii TaxID=97005 RepID=A0ABD2K701_HETSC
MEGACLISSVKAGEFETVRSLIEAGEDFQAGDRHRMTPLMYAAENNRLQIVQYLLNRGAQIDRRDKDGWTAMVFAVREDCPAIVNQLVESGANVNLVDYDRKSSPFIIGCQEDRFACVEKMLLSPGVDLNIVDTHGKTPLMHAIVYNRTNIANLFITNGADKQKTDNFGKTALDYARESKNNVLIALLSGN